MSTEKIREQFESWHRGIVQGEPTHDKYNNGDYRNQHVQRYWLGWQASRAAIEVELPYRVGCGDFGAIPSEFGEYIGYEDVKEEIESLGLKVKP
jgi:hypothetical protein